MIIGINKYLTMKYRKLIGEVTAKEIKELEKEKPEIGCPNQDLKFIFDPTHEFKENKSYFANPMFSTLKKGKKRRRRMNKSLLVKKSSSNEISNYIPKSKRTTAVTSVDGFEDPLLTRYIIKANNNSSFGFPSSRASFKLADIYPSKTPQKKQEKLEIKNIKLKNKIGGLTDQKHKGTKRRVASHMITEIRSFNSSEEGTPVTRYLKDEKLKLLNELKH